MTSYEQIMKILALYEELDEHILKYTGDDLENEIITYKAELFDKVKKIVFEPYRKKGGV